MLREVFESGRPLTYLLCAEEQRAVRVLDEVSRGLSASAPTPLWTWSLTEGMHRDGHAADAGTHDPRAALDFIVAHQGAAIFHLKDFHEPLRESAEIRRRLRDVHENCLDQGKFAVITSPVRFIPEEIERSVLFVELRQPDFVELLEFVRDETQRIQATTNERTRTPFSRSHFRALHGLTLDEARYALRRAAAGGHRLGPESLPALLEEKRLLVKPKAASSSSFPRPRISETSEGWKA